jgi:hypothetical protein
MEKLRQTRRRALYYTLKEARNQARSFFYERKSSNSAEQALTKLKGKAEKELCITIAFNTPWTIELLIDSWHHYCNETPLLVADNSNRHEASGDIRKICNAKNITYIKLPKNPVKHPSRSHGLALNWTWRNIVAKLDHLERVGFIDHDCYPIKQCRPNNQSSAFAYGVTKSSWIEENNAKNLWAGYMFFQQKSATRLQNIPFNFLPDALNGLDTGGSNWRQVYRKLETNAIEAAESITINSNELLGGYSSNEVCELQMIDQCFIHAAGVSHKIDEETKLRSQICQLLRNRMRA